MIGPSLSSWSNVVYTLATVALLPGRNTLRAVLGHEKHATGSMHADVFNTNQIELRDSAVAATASILPFFLYSPLLPAHGHVKPT